MKSQIMYIEFKGHDIIGEGRIGRVTFSKTEKTIYYKGRTFQSLSGQGYKANYFDTETGKHYWISGCKKRGNDSLYPGIIEIDDDVREEYWLKIRKMPECVHLSSMRSVGKYPKKNRNKFT